MVPVTTRRTAGRFISLQAVQTAAMRLLLALLALPVLFLAACGEERPAPSAAEARAANQNAAAEANKSFDKENPADPAALQPAPAK